MTGNPAWNSPKTAITAAHVNVRRMVSLMLTARLARFDLVDFIALPVGLLGLGRRPFGLG